MERILCVNSIRSRRWDESIAAEKREIIFGLQEWLGMCLSVWILSAFFDTVSKFRNLERVEGILIAG